uniref:Uncharacterized protein n=1 Tax=Populus trichocarpa TaxID=3694 RepID=A9PFD0_POPTR|nr:unknown [Populus trichocarpa]
MLLYVEYFLRNPIMLHMLFFLSPYQKRQEYDLLKHADPKF